MRGRIKKLIQVIQDGNDDNFYKFIDILEKTHHIPLANALKNQDTTNADNQNTVLLVYTASGKTRPFDMSTCEIRK